jgi:hypothetical protein
MNNLNELDTVALLKPMPQEGLSKGQVGTIVQELDGDTFEVEFTGEKGQTLMTIAVGNSNLMLLHFEPALA